MVRMTKWATGAMRSARRLAEVLGVIAVLGLAGCDDPAAPYVEFNGGGFVANYRNGTTIYGFNVKPMRQLAEGTVLEAVLDDPAGGQPIVLRETVKQPKLRYGFQTPPVRGIVKNKPYKGEIRILEAGTGKLLASYSKSFISPLDDKDLPNEALAPGVDYAPTSELVEIGKPPPQ